MTTTTCGPPRELADLRAQLLHDDVPSASSSSASAPSPSSVPSTAPAATHGLDGDDDNDDDDSWLDALGADIVLFPPAGQTPAPALGPAIAAAATAAAAAAGGGGGGGGQGPQTQPAGPGPVDQPGPPPGPPPALDPSSSPTPFPQAPQIPQLQAQAQARVPAHTDAAAWAPALVAVAAETTAAWMAAPASHAPAVLVLAVGPEDVRDVLGPLWRDDRCVRIEPSLLHARGSMVMAAELTRTMTAVQRARFATRALVDHVVLADADSSQLTGPSPALLVRCFSSTAARDALSSLTPAFRALLGAHVVCVRRRWRTPWSITTSS